MQETANEKWKQVLAYALAGVIGAGVGFLLRFATYASYAWVIRIIWSMPFYELITSWITHIYGLLIYVLMFLYIPLGVILGILSLAAFQKKKENRRRVLQVVSKLHLILALASILTVAGFFVGIGVINLGDQGFFVRWKRMSAPVKFVEIVDATTENVWAKAENGKLYSWDMLCSGDSQCENWAQAESIPTDIHHEHDRVEMADSCKMGRYKPRGPSGGTKQCVFTLTYPGDANITVYYALTDNGEIWYWERISYDLYSYFFLIFSCTCSGAVLGLLLGVIIFYRKTAQN